MIKKVKLEDAQAMNALHKSTFDLPSNDQLSQLAVGDLIKVNANGERFWCEIKEIKDGIITGRVDNELVQDELKLNDLIEIRAENIYSIYK